MCPCPADRRRLQLALNNNVMVSSSPRSHHPPQPRRATSHQNRPRRHPAAPPSPKNRQLNPIRFRTTPRAARPLEARGHNDAAERHPAPPPPTAPRPSEAQTPRSPPAPTESSARTPLPTTPDQTPTTPSEPPRGDTSARRSMDLGLPLGWLMFLIRGVRLSKDGHHGKAVSEGVP